MSILGAIGSVLGGPAGGVIGGIGSSLIGGLFGAKGQKDANDASIELANTAMQRKVKDLKAAGLNPMLAYTQGGAGSPQIGNVAGAGVSSAQQAGQTHAALQAAQQAKATTENTEAQTRLLEAQTQDIIRRTHAEADTASAAAWVNQQAMKPDLAGRQAASEITQDNARILLRTWEDQIERIRAERDSAVAHAKVAQGSVKADIVKREADAAIAALLHEKERLTKMPYELGNAALGNARDAFRRSGGLEGLQRGWDDAAKAAGDWLRNYGRRK